MIRLKERGVLAALVDDALWALEQVSDEIYEYRTVCSTTLQKAEEVINELCRLLKEMNIQMKKS